MAAAPRAGWTWALIAVTVMLAVACGRARQPAATSAPALESFIFTTEDGTTTRFWLADPARPSVRRLLLAADHQAGWAGSATVSPDGKAVAYTLLARGERDPDHGASLLLLDIRSRQSRGLASGVDLRSTIIWGRDGLAVTYQCFDGQRQQVWIRSISDDGGALLVALASGERLIPVGFSGTAGPLLGAHFGPQGVDLQQLRSGVSAEHVQHLSDGTARTFALSPTGGRLAFLGTGKGDAAPASRAYVLDLKGSSLRELSPDWGEMIGLAWEPTDVLVTGSAGPDAAIRTDGGDRLTSPASRGFLQPLSWSPSGRYLAVRAFSGDSAAESGNARDALLTRAGKLISITDALPARFTGWVSGSGQNAGH